MPPGLRWTAVRSSAPRLGCCKGDKGFFCSEHRQRTLTAQYRFLPALRLARRSVEYHSGTAQWIVLLDDDSFVFVDRLKRMLARYDAREP